MQFVSEEKFNLSANYCSHIEEHTNDPVYAEIEKEVEFLEMNTRRSILRSVCSIKYLGFKRELRDKTSVRELREQLEDMIQKDED